MPAQSGNYKSLFINHGRWLIYQCWILLNNKNPFGTPTMSNIIITIAGYLSSNDNKKKTSEFSIIHREQQ